MYGLVHRLCAHLIICPFSNGLGWCNALRDKSSSLRAITSPGHLQCPANKHKLPPPPIRSRPHGQCNRGAQYNGWVFFVEKLPPPPSLISRAPNYATLIHLSSTPLRKQIYNAKHTHVPGTHSRVLQSSSSHTWGVPKKNIAGPMTTLCGSRDPIGHRVTHLLTEKCSLITLFCVSLSWNFDPSERPFCVE